MESKSPYFSPRKTRNFVKQAGLKANLLQKVVQSRELKPDPVPSTSKRMPTNPQIKLEAVDNPPEKNPRASRRKPIEVESSQVRREKSPLEAMIFSEPVPSTSQQIPQIKLEPVDDPPEKKPRAPRCKPIKLESSPDRLEKTPPEAVVFPEPVPSTSQQVPQIKLEPVDDPPEKKTRAPRRKPIKVESSPDRLEKTPPEGLVVHKSPRKRTPIKEDCFEGWEPVNWRPMLENIRRMRLEQPAPVDSMGCDQFRDDVTVPAKTRRFHTLVSLMLSSQTKDQVNFECMQRLRKHGLTPEQIVATDADTLEKLIYPVSFYKNKAKFLRQTSAVLLSTYGGDIPDTLENLMKLPGVGAKMAHLCMRSGWNVVTGIGVDTHVHRISNWLGWVPRETRSPEETRLALERWLPFELWEEVNQLLVGFGQTVCTATYPRCNECGNADICPARGKHGIRRTPVKKEVKREELEF